MYVKRIKILSYLVTGRKNGSWQCSGFVIKSEAKEQLSDSGHVSRFSSFVIPSESYKVESISFRTVLFERYVHAYHI